MQKRKYNIDIQKIENPSYKQFILPEVLPRIVNWLSLCSPIYDQGEFESSAVNAFVAAFNFDNNGFIGSRLFLYYNDKIIDKRSSMHSCANALYTHGLCSEKIWPYSNGIDTPPTVEAYENGIFNQISKYDPMNIIQDLPNIKTCLMMKIPICVGISVYESFDKAKLGNIPMPDIKKEKMIGGHAIMLVGYNDEIGHFVFANCFGESWGNNGFGTIPYEYILTDSMTTDLWVFKRAIARKVKKDIEKKKFKCTKRGVEQVIEIDNEPIVADDNIVQSCPLRFNGKARHLIHLLKN